MFHPLRPSPLAVCVTCPIMLYDGKPKEIWTTWQLEECMKKKHLIRPVSLQRLPERRSAIILLPSYDEDDIVDMIVKRDSEERRKT